MKISDRCMLLIMKIKRFYQVNEKEKEKILTRQKNFQEGLAIRAETEQRNRRLRETMERKCREMEQSHVPEVYINEVKKMIENIK